MKNIIFIQNKRAFVIFAISCILIILVLKIQSRQSNIKSQKYEFTQSKINDNLDSVNKVKNEIIYYDSVNLLDERIEILDAIFSDINIPTKPVDSENLFTKLDSLNMYIITLKEQKNRYIKSFDSLSPVYSFAFRDSIQLELDTLKNKLIVNLEDGIDRFNSELLLIKIMKYLLSILLFILFPLRWILQWFCTNKNGT